MQLYDLTIKQLLQKNDLDRNPFPNKNTEYFETLWQNVKEEYAAINVSHQKSDFPSD